MSNAQAFIEEGLRRWGKLSDEQWIEMPWKASQIPIKIHTDKKEVRVFYRPGRYGKNG